MILQGTRETCVSGLRGFVPVAFRCVLPREFCWWNPAATWCKLYAWAPFFWVCLKLGYLSPRCGYYCRKFPPYIYTYIWRFHKWRYTPNSSIFIRCSLISHPCGGSPMTMDPPRSTWCSHDVLSTKDGDKCLASCPKGKYVEYQGPQRPGEASKGSPKVPKVVAMDMMEILASEV